MNSIKLSEIVKNIDAVCDNAGDVIISDVSTDTRTIKRGDLFIALVGEKFDGHNYIDTAVQNGAVAVVCSKPVKTTVPVVTVPIVSVGVAPVSPVAPVGPVGPVGPVCPIIMGNGPGNIGHSLLSLFGRFIHPCRILFSFHNNI